MKSAKTGVLLVNLGTPDSPSVSDVRKYLREFLMDGRVIDIPLVSRWLFVNMIIAPFRAPKSAIEYQKLWEDRGSPLRFYGEEVCDMLQNELGDEYVVVLGMRYQNPSIKDALRTFKNARVEKIVVIPLFPQYASASTGSVVQKVNELINGWQTIPEIKIVNKFLDHPKFIEAFASNARVMMSKKKYDYVIFSYHGLPERQIHKASDHSYCQINNTCCSKYNSHNQLCYRAQCFETTRLMSKALDLKSDQVITTFQSRLGRTPWIRPFTDTVLKELPGKGIKRVLTFSPSFVADCLETTVEVGKTFKKDFIAEGGECWDLVPSLNNSDLWVACLKDLVKR